MSSISAGGRYGVNFLKMRKKPTERQVPKKIFLCELVSLLIWSSVAWAAEPVVLTLKADREEVYVHEPLTVTFTARLTPLTTPVPSRIHLSRLQWSGVNKEIAVLRDDGSHGDLAKND